MPTVFSHAAPVLALAAILGGKRLPWRLALFGVLCAVLPDADVISFKLGVSYADALGHRGFSHSLLFALILGLPGPALAPWLRCGRLTALAVGFFAAASHLLLDAMTNGGLGVGAFRPWDQRRYFLPWRPVRVSPLSLHAFLSRQGLDVLLSELRWIWLPCLAGVAAARLIRRPRR